MQNPTDPALMTPDERMREVAGILSRGYFRHREMRVNGLSESPGNVLDVSRENERPCADLVDTEENR